MGDNQSGTVYVFYNVSHSKRFTAARYAHEHLRAYAVQHAFGKALNSLRLVARRSFGQSVRVVRGLKSARTELVYYLPVVYKIAYHIASAVLCMVEREPHGVFYAEAKPGVFGDNYLNH